MAGAAGARGELAVHAVEGGLRDLSFDAPADIYARQLSRYITCASTIQSHVRRNYGVTYKLADISAMQARFGNRQAVHRAANGKVEALPEDYASFRVAPSASIRAAFAQKAETNDLIKIQHVSPIFVPPPMLSGDIIAAMAKDMGISAADVIGRDRTAGLIPARAAVAYVLHKRGNSLSSTGRKMGGRDHSSILYLVRKFEETATEAMRELAARYIGGRGA